MSKKQVVVCDRCGTTTDSAGEYANWFTLGSRVYNSQAWDVQDLCRHCWPQLRKFMEGQPLDD